MFYRSHIHSKFILISKDDYGSMQYILSFRLPSKSADFKRRQTKIGSLLCMDVNHGLLHLQVNIGCGFSKIEC